MLNKFGAGSWKKRGGHLTVFRFEFQFNQLANCLTTNLSLYNILHTKCIYIYIERERERERSSLPTWCATRRTSTYRAQAIGCCWNMGNPTRGAYPIQDIFLTTTRPDLPIAGTSVRQIRVATSSRIGQVVSGARPQPSVTDSRPMEAKWFILIDAKAKVR